MCVKISSSNPSILASSATTGPNLLSPLPFDLFEHIWAYLTMTETRNLLQSNTLCQMQVDQIRKSLTTLDLSNRNLDLANIEYIVTHHPGLISLDLSRSNLCDAGLKIALDHLPNLRSLDLSGCPKITSVGIQHLTKFVIGKKMTKLNLSARYNPRLDATYDIPLEKLKAYLVARRESAEFVWEEKIEQLISLFFAEESDFGDPHLFAEEVLASARSITTIPKQDWNLLLKNLDFSELVYLDITHTAFRINRESIDLLIKRLKRCPKLVVCNVSFSGQRESTPEAMHRLLIALPLKQFREIQLRWELADDHLHYIASQLAENLILEELFIHSDTQNIDLEQHIAILESLQSPFLRSLRYHCSTSSAESTHPKIRAYLAEKFPHWQNIHTLFLFQKISIPALREMFSIDPIGSANMQNLSDENFWNAVGLGPLHPEFALPIRAEIPLLDTEFDGPRADAPLLGAQADIVAQVAELATDARTLLVNQYNALDRYNPLSSRWQELEDEEVHRVRLETRAKTIRAIAVLALSGLTFVGITLYTQSNAQAL